MNHQKQHQEKTTTVAEIKIQKQNEEWSNIPGILKIQEFCKS
jgi:hypothetical protein